LFHGMQQAQQQLSQFGQAFQGQVAPAAQRVQQGLQQAQGKG
jgi:hypothetical protein